jgi:hypothetical protein
MATPGTTTRIAPEPARARGVFVLNRHRSANRTGSRHVASEPDQIRMRHDSVGDVNGEIIDRIARASLRHKNEVPGSIVGRSSLCDGGQGS